MRRRHALGTAHSEFGVIDQHGKIRKRHKLATDPTLMNDWLDSLSAKHKYLSVEGGPLTQWIS
jgi:hypothetical protein